MTSKGAAFFIFITKFVTVFRHLFVYDSEKTSPTGSGLMYLIILLFGGFVTWAYFAKFDQVITAEGKVFPFSRLQEIEHYEEDLLNDSC